MSSQPPRTPNGDESNPTDNQSNDQSYRKNSTPYNNNNSGNRGPRPTTSNYQSPPNGRQQSRPAMSSPQMGAVQQQTPQWQQQAGAHQQQQQQQMYVYPYTQPPTAAYVAPQTQNGQYYQYYPQYYPAQQMYQASPQGFTYAYYPQQSPQVIYAQPQQAQTMVYQMPQTQQPVAPQITQPRQPAAPVAPAAAPAAPVAAAAAPVVAAVPQPAAVEESTSAAATESSAPAAAAPTPVATVAPATAKKRPIIKGPDGSVIEIGELVKKPVAPKEPEAPKVAEPEPVVPSIPSMPVSLPKAEAPTVNSFPVDLPKPAVVEKVVEEKPAAVESTPVKEAPAVVLEVDESKIQTTPQQSSQRRLVPHGMKNAPTPGGSKTIRKYSRQEILNLKPADLPKLDLFNNIQVQKLDAPTTKRPGDNAGGGGSGDRGDNWGNKKQPKNATGGGNDWKHESVPANKKPSKPAKPEITDPMKLIELYITDILNKIAPEKFEVLSNQLLEADMKDSIMLDKLVQLIFEKAVKEPHFAEMYARLCTFLKDEGGKKWVFFKVVKNTEDNTFFWIKDYSFPAMASGPFFSKSEVFASEDLGAMKPYTGSVDGCEYYLNKQTLMRLIPAKSASGDQWFATHVSFDEIQTENRSGSVYTTEAEAQKNATSTVSFRGSLAHSCEREFQNSVADENLFDEVDQELKSLIANRATISEADYIDKEAAIGEKRNNLKQRMLGNIRFVGELYKQKLLNTDTMHECIITLLGHPGNWKTEHDIQDLELLCKLLTTVGSYLEQKSKGAKKKPEWETNFEAYFDRLLALSKDKTLEARIRFSLEDVIDLRRNNWKERREKEGPLKISEIHQKAQEEEHTKGQITRQNSSGDARNGNRGGGGDARHGGASGGKGRGDSNKGGRGGSSGRGGETVNKGKAPQVAAPTTPTGPVIEAIDAKSLDFSNDTLKRRAKTALLEYLNGEDIAEVKATLREGSNVFLGYLMNDIIEKLLNAKAEVNDRLMLFFNDEELMKAFQTYSMVIEAALELNEFFKVLVDTTLDFKEAPEKIGQVVRVLIQKNIISSAKVNDITIKLKKYNVDLDYNPVDDINSIYERFLKSLTA